MKSSYFPGCSLTGLAKEYDISNRAVIEKLGVDLPEIEDWSCCGSIAATSTSHLLSVALPARNLALAERENRNIVAPCAECSNILGQANLALKKNKELREKINEILAPSNLEYKGKIEVKHLLEYYLNDIGLETISKYIEKPLVGLKTAPYYGCLIVRPRTINTFDSVENPQSLDKLITATGATSLDYTSKTKCCGASLMMTKEDIATELIKDILLDAENIGAQCIIVACPFCHFNLDAKQSNVKKSLKEDIPILYLTQLLGIALGINPKSLALEKNSVSPFKLLNRLDFL